MKRRIFALFLIITIVCTMVVPLSTVFADTDEDGADSFDSDDNTSYVDSLEPGDVNDAPVTSEKEEPEEIIIPKTQFDDIAGRECEEAVRVLNKIGIINGLTPDEFGPDGFTTRSQMASIILRMLKLGGIQNPNSPVFTDVPATHPNFSDITSAYTLGIVNGNGDGSFNPDGEVSYNELIKMVVCALGYEVLAESKGGYPSGYYSVAVQTDILKDIQPVEGAVTRETLALVLYNALTVDIFERTSYGDNESYGTKRNDNVLTRYLGYGYTEGIVTDNGVTALLSSSTIDNDQIKIDSVTFNNEGIDAKNLIGRAVKAYYKKETNTKINTLVICFVNDELNSELVLTHDDILSSSRENGSFVFDYMNGNSQKKISVYSDSYIYNGKGVGVVSLNDPSFATMISNLRCGDITLISNDGDKNYDVLVINEYKSYEIERIDSIDKILYLGVPDDSVYTLSLESDSIDIIYNIYNEKGNNVEFSSLRTGDVVSFYESTDKGFFEIYVSKRKVESVIDEITSNDEYVINGETYKRYPELPAGELEVGKKSVYLIDIYSNIVCFDDEAALDGNYALLMDVGYATAGGLNSYPQIRVLTTDGNFETIDCENKIYAYTQVSGKVEEVDFTDLICTQKVNLNYTNVSPYMLWYTDNSVNFTYDIRYNQLEGTHSRRFYYRPWLSDKEKSDIASRKIIWYEKNKDGRIDKIIVPDVPSPYGKLSLLNPTDSYGMLYRSENNTAVEYATPSLIKISPHAVVFQGLAVDYTEKDYHVAENGVYSINNGLVSKLYLYSINGSSSAGIVLRYYHLPYEALSNLEMVVVDRVSRDADDKIKLYGYSKGIEYEAVIEENTRLVQRYIYCEDILAKKDSEQKISFTNPVNGKNLFGYMNDVAGGTKSFYELYEGMRWPYADEKTISKGDVILVGKDNGDDVCYVEMMIRAADGLMQTVMGSANFAGKVTNGNDFALGVVRDFDDNAASITIHAPVNDLNPRQTTSGDLKINNTTSYQANQRFNAIKTYGYYTMKYDVNYSQCFVYEYDYERGIIKKISGNTLKQGDIVIVRGNIYAPKEIIVYKNNPALPDLSDYEAYEAMS